MDIALLIARLVLAAVFAAAGVAKLADLGGSRRALVGFGVPEPLAGPGAVALPLAELAAAVLLLPATTAGWGALAALGLLAAFVVAITVNLARGRTPDCHCFGALHSEPAGPRVLARNGALAALAGFAAIRGSSDPGPSALAWVGRLDTAGAALLATALALGVLASVGSFTFLHLLRQHGRLLIKLDRIEQVLTEAGLSTDVEEEMPRIGLEPGIEAPDFAVRDLDGRESTLGSLLESGRPALLVFTSPTCGPCKALMPSVARWQRIHSSVLTIAVASSGDKADVRAEIDQVSPGRVLLDARHDLYRAYQANGTPSAVLIRPDRTIGSWIASGPDWIERLLTDAISGAPARESGIPVGEDAPPADLVTLDGEPVVLSALYQEDTVVLFWNPSCGFCRRMHADLITWESSTRAGTPGLVIVSAGDAAEVRAEGFRSTVLLDPDWSASGAFGAGGTPMAVRIDADGRVASRVAAGADAVFELLAGTSGRLTG